MPGASPRSSKRACSAGRFHSFGCSMCLKLSRSSSGRLTNSSNEPASNFLLLGRTSTMSPVYTSAAKRTTTNSGSRRYFSGAIYSTPYTSCISSRRSSTFPGPLARKSSRRYFTYLELWGFNRPLSKSSRASRTAAPCLVWTAPFIQRKASWAACARFLLVIKTENSGYSGARSSKWTARQVEATRLTISRTSASLPPRRSFPLIHSCRTFVLLWWVTSKAVIMFSLSHFTSSLRA